MGIYIGVFVREERLPRAELWSAALGVLRMPVQVVNDPDEDLGTQSFRLDEQDVHVQVMVIRRTDEEDWDELREDLGRRARLLAEVDTFVVYRFSGSTDEMICASAGCAGLVAAAGGVLWDMEGDEVLTGQEAIALNRQIVDDGLARLAEVQPLRTAEAQGLWEAELVPRLEAAGTPSVRAHGWILTVGPVGWLAPLVLLSLSGGPSRLVAVATKVVPLYVAHPLARGPTHHVVGAGRSLDERTVAIPVGAGPERDGALDRLAELISTDAVPHLAEIPGLDAVAAVLARHLDDGEGADVHAAEALAATQVLRGEVDEAVRRYRQVVRVHEADDPAYRLAGGWADQQQRRATEMAVLAATDRDEAVRRLAAVAQASAQEIGIPPPDLP